MKIGILTIIGQANYGNKLQNYAVDRVLKGLGADVVTFDYTSKPSVKTRLKRIVKDILKVNDYYGRKRIECFNAFDNKYLKTDRVENAANYDYVVCGSDQIWNCTIGFINTNLETYFGAFMPPEKRIAYSASIGADYIPDEYQAVFAEYTSEMKAISVREEKGAEIIKHLTGKDVCVTIDPTLMLTENQWLEIASRPDYITDEKFILTYFLGNYLPEIKEYIYNVAKEKGLKVIDLEADYKFANEIDNLSYYMTCADEFIWLISNCEMMFTDSFHGSVFSIIMDKPFRCFLRNQDGLVKMSSRMDTLFKLFHIEKWCYGDLKESADTVFYKDYSAVNSVLDEERAKALHYLKGALNIDEK